MHAHTSLSPDIPQRRFKGRIGQWVSTSTPEADPQCFRAAVCCPLVTQIAAKHWPEVVRNRNAMLVSRSLEPHGGHAAILSNVGEGHAQDSVSARALLPIADSLTGAEQKRENAFVTPRT